MICIHPQKALTSNPAMCTWHELSVHDYAAQMSNALMRELLNQHNKQNDHVQSPRVLDGAFSSCASKMLFIISLESILLQCQI